MPGVIERTRHLKAVASLLDQFPVVGLLGARQAGKTTLARSFQEQQNRSVTRFDLEDPSHLARLEDPKLALEPLEGLKNMVFIASLYIENFININLSNICSIQRLILIRMILP